jgi:hypothetical protein
MSNCFTAVQFFGTAIYKSFAYFNLPFHIAGSIFCRTFAALKSAINTRLSALAATINFYLPLMH